MVLNVFLTQKIFIRKIEYLSLSFYFLVVILFIVELLYNCCKCCYHPFSHIYRRSVLVYKILQNFSMKMGNNNKQFLLNDSLCFLMEVYWFFFLQLLKQKLSKTTKTISKPQKVYIFDTYVQCSLYMYKKKPLQYSYSMLTVKVMFNWPKQGNKIVNGFSISRNWKKMRCWNHLII